MDKKALIIGMDGVPYSLLLNYLRNGFLPNLKRILSDGHKAVQMDASIPDVSSTSWTSFMTGVNPGEHGIYGFMELRQGTYKLFFPNFRDVYAPTIWDVLANNAARNPSTLSKKYSGAITAPRRSIVMNIPQTYPAVPINGVLTAGFVCPDLKKGTYPESAYDYLSSIGYLSDIDAELGAASPQAFFDEAFRSLEKRQRAYEHFMSTGDWSLFIGVITETDRIHHFFYDAAENAQNQHHSRFIEFYAKMDVMIGSLYDAFMEATKGSGLFMTMSDHGFTVLRKEVYLNAWLKDKGFLRLDPTKEYFEQIDAGTKAFALDPARIYVNVEGRYPKGTVKEGDKRGVVDDIIEALDDLKDEDGAPVVRTIYRGEELYKGGRAHLGPDLVVLPRDGYDLKGSLKKDSVFGTGRFKGMHTSYDAHAIMPSGVELVDRLKIEDLASIILDRTVF